MGNVLPEIEESRFRSLLIEVVQRNSIQGHSAKDWVERTSDSLMIHYRELRRWNPRISLVGPGTADQIVERHYGESLAAMSLFRESDQAVVDVGSGGGFPGFVLASARIDLDVYLVDSKEKKAHFLKTAARRCKLSTSVINGRVDTSLPAGLPERIDVVTSRALAMSQEVFDLFLGHSPNVRFLLWVGNEIPDIPDELSVYREIPISGSLQRRILEVCTSPKREIESEGKWRFS